MQTLVRCSFIALTLGLCACDPAPAPSSNSTATVCNDEESECYQTYPDGTKK